MHDVAKPISTEPRIRSSRGTLGFAIGGFVAGSVDSLHHQAVKTIAPQLRVTGKSEDGVIEALESPQRRFLVAVQWHPEEIDDVDWVRRLFQGFAKAASTRG